MPDQIAKAGQAADWAQVAIKAIDVDPRNVVVLALVALLFFLAYLLGKFIDAKFISRQVTKVITAAGGVENSNKSAIESNKKLARDMEKRLNDHASAIVKDRQDTRDEIARLRRELNDKLDKELTDFKVAIGKLAEGNRSTGEAIEKFQIRMNDIHTNYERLLAGLRKIQGGNQ